MATSYSNLGGTGNRTSLISVTSTFVSYTTSTPPNLIDGSFSASAAGGWSISASGPVAGKYHLFDFGFGLETKVVIDEITFRQSNTTGRGVFQWQGSDDNVAFTNIGGTFTLGGSSTQVISTLAGNVTGYRYYRLMGISGNDPFTGWWLEFEFKIDGFVPPIYMVASNTNVFTDGSVNHNATIPASAVIGDLLLAYVMHRDTVTAPSGWALVDSLSVTILVGTTQYLSVYSKTCSSGDIGAVENWVLATPTRISVSVQAYRGSNLGVLGFNSSSLVNVPANKIPAASISTNNLNQMMVSGVSFIHSAGSGSTTITPPSGMVLSTVGSVADNRLGCARIIGLFPDTLTGDWGSSYPAGTNTGISSISVLIGSTDEPPIEIGTAITQLPILVVDSNPQPARISQLPLLLVYSEGQPAKLTQMPVLVLYSDDQPARATQVPVLVSYSTKPVPFPEALIPEVPVKETWTWKTALTMMQNGREQRARLRDYPRIKQSLSILVLDDSDRRNVYTMLMRYIKNTFLYPLFQYNAFVSSSAAQGTSRLNFNVPEVDVRGGESMAVIDPQLGTVTVVQVSTVDGTGANLVEPLPFDVGVNWQVCPVMEFRTTPGTGLTMSNISGEIEIAMESIKSRTFLRPTASPALTVKDGILIVPERHLSNEGVKEDFNMDVEWLDNGTSIPVLRTQMQAPTVGGTRVYSYDRRKETDYWKAVLDSLKGRQGVAMFPTFRNDLSLRSPIALGATEFTTSVVEFLNYWREPNYRYIRIESAGGVRYRRIAEVLPTYGVEGFPVYLTVKLFESIGSSVGDNAIRAISFMNLCRLDTDSVTVTHETLHSEISLAIQAVNL